MTLSRCNSFLQEHGTHLFRPVAIGTDYTVTQIACGDTHCIAISGHGAHVFTWGYGKNGRLGHGDTMDVMIPRIVEGIGSFFDTSKNIVGAGCGVAHTAVVCEDDSVYVWGSNSSGQCGVFDEPSLEQVDNVEANRPPDVLVPTKVDFPPSKKKKSEKGAGGKNLNGQSSRTLDVSKSAATLGARESGRIVDGSGERSSFWFSGRRADNTNDSPQRGSAKGGGSPRMSVDSKKGLWSSLSKPNKKDSLGKSNEGNNTPQVTSARWGLSSLRGSVYEASPSEEEEKKEAKINMVECGDCHTLVLRCDGELWLLGSGMDRRYRRQNSSIKVGDGKKIKDVVQLDPAFLPRQVKRSKTTKLAVTPSSLPSFLPWTPHTFLMPHTRKIQTPGGHVLFPIP